MTKLILSWIIIEVIRKLSGTESWEKLPIAGLKPQPRAESVALAVSELLIRGNGLDSNSRPRPRSQKPRQFCNRVSPQEAPARPSFLKEISKLSQINLSRLSHPAKCSYSVLSGHDDNEPSPQEVVFKQISKIAFTNKKIYFWWLMII